MFRSRVLPSSFRLALKRVPTPHAEAAAERVHKISDAGNVKTSAPPGIHDDIVISLALATWTPGRFNPVGRRHRVDMRDSGSRGASLLLDLPSVKLFVEENQPQILPTTEVTIEPATGDCGSTQLP